MNNKYNALENKIISININLHSRIIQYMIIVVFLVLINIYFFNIYYW